MKGQAYALLSLLISIAVFTFLAANYTEWVNLNNIGTGINCREVVVSITPVTTVTVVECDNGIPVWFSVVFIAPVVLVAILAAKKLALI